MQLGADISFLVFLDVLGEKYKSKINAWNESFTLILAALSPDTASVASDDLGISRNRPAIR